MIFVCRNYGFDPFLGSNIAKFSHNIFVITLNFNVTNIDYTLFTLK